MLLWLDKHIAHHLMRFGPEWLQDWLYEHVCLPAATSK